MRLGQIARKLEIKTEEVTSFIKKEFDVELENDPNVKLEEDHVTALKDQFEKVEETPVVEDKKAEEETAELDPELEKVWAEQSVATSVEEDQEKEEEVEDSTSEDKAEETEKEASENEENKGEGIEEAEVDPDAELIKAPKIELDGPKVVGKIDLPTKKEEEAKEETESSEIEVDVDDSNAEAIDPELEASMALINQDVKEAKKAVAEEVEENIEEEEEEFSIYKDKKGIYHFSEQQKKNRLESLERIKNEKRLEAQKKKKARHYAELMAEKEIKQKSKPKKKKSDPKSKTKEEKPEPKGLWGRFVNWLND